MNRDQITNLVAVKIQEANALYGLKLTIPTIEWMNLKRTAGIAYCKTNKLAFNETLALHNPATFHQIVIHEVAHLVHRKLFPLETRAHNADFYAIDLKLGGRGTRCHSYDTSVTGKQKTYTRHLCTCSCGKEFKVTKKIVQNIDKYHCLKCKGQLIDLQKTISVTK